ncbi:MAG: hypothetical protein WCD35_08720 [Mycobacteriales bacterium]
MLSFSAFIGGVYAGLLGAVSAAANGALISSATFTDPSGGHAFHLGLPREIRWFFIGAGLGWLVAGAICATIARRIWRRDRLRLGWGFLIAVPLTSVVSIPVGLLALGLGAATSKVADVALPSQNYIDLRNDTSATVEVRYCVKQECAGATSVTLLPGRSHRYAVPKDDPTPDEWAITGTGLRLRCDLVPTLGSDETGPINVRVSEADTETC